MKRRCSEAYAVPPVTRCGLRFKTTTLTEPTDVRDMINAVAAEGLRGWCCFTDKVIRVDGSSSLDDVPTDRPLLSAELARGPTSVSLLCRGDDWLCTEAEHLPEGRTHLAVRTRYRAIEPGEPGEDVSSGEVVYDVYWLVEAELTPLEAGDAPLCRPVGPCLARFVELTPARSSAGQHGGKR